MSKSNLSNVILIVDDDQNILCCTRDMITDRFPTMKVLCCETPLEAIKTFIKHKSTITHAILDFELPNYKGTSLAEVFKIDNPNIKIALFTGHDDFLQTEESVNSLNRVILKPTMGDLIDFISAEKF